MTTNIRSRRALTLLELTVVAALLTVLLTVITQTFAAVERHMRRTDERAQSLRIVENLLEQVTLGEWDDIKDDRIGELKIPAELLTRWPNAKMVANVVDEADPVASKRITISVQPGNAVRERLVTLTTWVYRTPEN